MSLNEFILGCFVIIPCILAIWYLWNYEEIKEKRRIENDDWIRQYKKIKKEEEKKKKIPKQNVKEKEIKKETPQKIQSALNSRELFIKIKKEEEEEMEKEIKIYKKYPSRDRSDPAEIKAEIKAEECFRKYVSLGNLSVGSKNDYFNFLNAYLKSGMYQNCGRICHYENSFQRSQEIYIAENEIEIFPSYISPKKMIIVMPGCRVIHGDKGNNNFYCYDNISNQKYARWIPTYQDWAERFEKCI